jgi:hypothetical protein
MDKPTILIEAQYFPPVQYFVVLAQAAEVWVEAQEHYQKRSYRNRCRIAGANGQIRLSVPLEKGKNEQMPIQEVQIAYRNNWHAAHWRSIRSAYGKAPFFEFYAEEIKPLLYAKPSSLFELNLSLAIKLLELIQLDVSLHLTDEYQPQAPDRALDLRGAIHPKQPQLGFQAGTYPQVFLERHGFLPNLSILDLLFCAGPQSAVLLQQFAEQNPLV